MELLKGSLAVLILFIILSLFVTIYNYFSKILQEGMEGSGQKDMEALGPTEVSTFTDDADTHLAKLPDDPGTGELDVLNKKELGADAVDWDTKIGCQAPPDGLEWLGGEPVGWGQQYGCEVETSDVDAEGFPAYKVCGGKASEAQEHKGYFSSDCEKRWKVDSKGTITQIAAVTSKEIPPGSTEKELHESPREIPSQVNTSQYERWIPENYSGRPDRSIYWQMGRRYIQALERAMGRTPKKLSSVDAIEVGALLARVYSAEVLVLAKNSLNNHQEFIVREMHLLDKVRSLISEIPGDFDLEKVEIPRTRYIRCPGNYVQAEANNRYGYYPPNKLVKKIGYAFLGPPMYGTPVYTNFDLAREHCRGDMHCGGINCDVAAGKYSLMPMGAQLGKQADSAVYVKTSQRDTSLPAGWTAAEGAGLARPQWDPGRARLRPKPYNSLMDLFP